MNLWDSFVERWWSWIVPASWQLVILVCLVAVITRCLRNATPRLKHCLWLLVLVKVFLPPTLTLPIAIGHWGIRPFWQTILENFDSGSDSIRRPSGDSTADTTETFEQERIDNRTKTSLSITLNRWPKTLCLTWVSGCLVYFFWIVANHFAITRWLQTGIVIDEGPVRIALERIALKLGLKTVPDLMTAETLTSPFLVGAVRPCIVLPRALAESLHEGDLNAVLTHELVHWRHGDTWIGWFQVLGQGLFWFHPLVWWAGSELRHERECACDEASLRIGELDPQQYGESIFRVLMATRSQSLVVGSLTGVFERGSRLQSRMEEIMSYRAQQRRFGWFSGLALLAAAVLLLPMAPGTMENRHQQAIGADQSSKTNEVTKNAKKQTEYPTIIKAIPEIGATDVASSLKEIQVTFDRDMQKGMSWTGGPPLFPPTDSNRQAYWLNDRTCVLPVNLESGSFYRLGLNSKSFQNFKSTNKVALPPTTFFFVTAGAKQEIIDHARVPKIVKFEPANGAEMVDASTKVISLTFDIPMGDGMSWVGSGENFPKSIEGKSASWSDDHLTCTLPVKLEPNHKYEIGVNSLWHNNFQSKSGIQVAPEVYSFKTGKSSAD